MKSPAPPVGTYRLQFNRHFTFDDAAIIVPYLHALGISHIYASPFLKARAGSPHGYDIVDHNALNPEIGDESAFGRYVDALDRHRMGQILDIVPNHMGVGGDDNKWWLDVLENGEASSYAQWFDIDWHPANPVLHNKVLLPFLGDHYGTVLDRGELRLEFENDAGAFAVRYFEHLFPIDPRTYPQILGHRPDALDQRMKDDPDNLNAFKALAVDFLSLPRRTDLSGALREQRYKGAAEYKARLATLCRNCVDLDNFLNENVSLFNGSPDRPESFDLLHRLLEAQAWRLSYWQVAANDINYRRFFDINELAGLQMDRDEVFDGTHHLVKQLIGNISVNGLRVDHPDGLSDPLKYLRDVQRLVERAGQAADEFYLVVEKILMEYERLPDDWPVAGSTGYDAGRLINGFLVDPESERKLTRLYHRFIGQQVDFDDLLYDRKKLIVRSVLASELTVMANLLAAIAQADRHTRDFTYQGLRDALVEIAACCPVYRTYVTPDRITDDDKGYIHWAVALAKKRSPANSVQIFDFIEDLITFRHHARYGDNVQHQIERFIVHLQQYTAPVMAKGLEDTAAYIYNRLMSLNEVGSMPTTFGVHVNAFHHANRQRFAHWPHGMVSSSTHDSKRSEDVRARISVISELPDQWRHHVGRWSRINRRKKSLVNDRPAPSRNDEYLLYQILLGAWPLQPLNAEQLDLFRDRIEAYMLKAVREAKVHTSWINPNEEYEEAVRRFVRALLRNTGRNAFLADFLPFKARVARFGLLSSLSQTLLKLTVPGIPDIYQGNELWTFHLVDPDNRQAVDFNERVTALESLKHRIRNGDDLCRLARELLDRIEDGQAKLYTTLQALAARREYPQLFNEGEYIGLPTFGSRAGNLCAFARRFEEHEIVVVAARWFARLLGDDTLPGTAAWEDTWIEMTGAGGPRTYRNLLTDERVASIATQNGFALRAAEVMRNFTIALLLEERA